MVMKLERGVLNMDGHFRRCKKLTLEVRTVLLGSFLMRGH